MEQIDYTAAIEKAAQEVFDFMRPRISEADMKRLVKAFEMAREAHKLQARKTGEPYIFHPIAVARIAAIELNLDVNAVIAALLHDVVEDNGRIFPLKKITEEFGDDVSKMVDGVTKRKNRGGQEWTVQVDTYKRLLNSLNRDLRTILIKLADRLHNMRTLTSMPTDKQMKIAGETDYFYAPFATRLGLYNVKTELENLSLRFRVPHEYQNLVNMIDRDQEIVRPRLEGFLEDMRRVLSDAGIKAEVRMEWRKPYSLWRKMRKYGDDFHHLKYRHYTDVIIDVPEGENEKEAVLNAYSVLTNHFNEKPNGIINYIDTPKENGYQSFHIKLLAGLDRWQEVHISSQRMVRDSTMGCITNSDAPGIKSWIEKFNKVVHDMESNKIDINNFMDSLAASFYNDDIKTFAPDGKQITLPQKATPLDFAYEIHTELGHHAKYAKVNGFITSIKAPLHRGDVVEIHTDDNCHPTPEWLDHTVSYKARKAIRSYLAKQPKPAFTRCPDCCPIPGHEVIGYQEKNGPLTIHRRDCPTIIRLASGKGENIKSVDFVPDQTLYPIDVEIVAIDRPHMLMDLVGNISNTLKLSIGSINTSTVDSISTIRIVFYAHSFTEVQNIISHIGAIDGVDTVKLVENK